MPTSIDGTIRKVMYAGRSFGGGNFVIAAINGNQVVKGDLEDPREGEAYRFFGDWRAEAPPRTGNYFAFTSCEVLVDRTTDGVVQYLKNYVDGLGTIKASMIVETFGEDTLAILRVTPERAAEVRGVTPAIVDAIRTHFEAVGASDPATEAKLTDMFADLRLPRRVIKGLMRAYREAAPAKVMANPYLLLQFRRVGWSAVDTFATTTAKYRPAGTERHRGAIVEAFERLAGDGHTCATVARVNEVAGQLLGMAVGGEAWKTLVAEGEVVVHRPAAGDNPRERVVGLARYAEAERTVARKVVELMEAGLPFPGPLTIADKGGADEQERAVRVIAGNPVAILTGAPGVGKTTTVSLIIKSLIEMGLPASSILFLSPYGKSAKRGAELLAERGISGVVCSTVHRALGPAPIAGEPGADKDDAKAHRGREEFGFQRHENNPLDATFIVISEGSTLDITLAASLFKAIRPGTRVLIDGDEEQLKSVGPGAFLRDLMSAGVPSFTLTEIRRSASAGTVVHACHAIRAGRVPRPADCIDLEKHKNWMHIEEDNPDRIADLVVSLVDGVKTFDKLRDVQVITPKKDGLPFAVRAMNERLAYLLNPVAREAMDRRAATGDQGRLPSYFVGDKVIRTANGFVKELVTRDTWDAAQRDVEPWDREAFQAKWKFRGVEYAFRKTLICNGDMGEVVDIVKVAGAGNQVVVKLWNPETLVRLPQADAHLMQAYAMTVHRVIGSGFPVVIAPIHSSIYSELLTRELFYTWISRTQSACITVGEGRAIESAVSRRTVHLRQSRLRELLAGELAEMAERQREREAREDMGELGERLTERLECQLIGVGDETD